MRMDIRFELGTIKKPQETICTMFLVNFNLEGYCSGVVNFEVTVELVNETCPFSRFPIVAYL